MSPTLLRIHKRALWTALAAARGDVEHAANALGISVRELLVLLDGDPASVWTAAASSVSGVQRKVSADDDDSGNQGENDAG